MGSGGGEIQDAVEVGSDEGVAICRGAVQLQEALAGCFEGGG